jgi:hypothetical protein
VEAALSYTIATEFSQSTDTTISTSDGPHKKSRGNASLKKIIGMCAENSARIPQAEPAPVVSDHCSRRQLAGQYERIVRHFRSLEIAGIRAHWRLMPDASKGVSSPLVQQLSPVSPVSDSRLGDESRNRVRYPFQ